MKSKLIPVAAFLVMILVSNSQGQVGKGRFLLGAGSDLTAFLSNTKKENTIDGNTTETDGSRMNQFGFTPSAGYFVIDGLAAGLFLTSTPMVQKGRKRSMTVPLGPFTAAAKLSGSVSDPANSNTTSSNMIIPIPSILNGSLNSRS